MFQTTNQHGLTLISQEYMANQEHVESLFSEFSPVSVHTDM